ncbi:unnamed protein product, partial [marine sediment metagenome]
MNQQGHPLALNTLAFHASLSPSELSNDGYQTIF